MCDMLDSDHIRGKMQDYVDLKVPCNGAPRLRAELGMHASQPQWPWLCERKDAIVPSTEVDLLQDRSTGVPEVVRSVASPVGDDEESLGLVPPRRAL